MLFKNQPDADVVHVTSTGLSMIPGKCGAIAPEEMEALPGRSFGDLKGKTLTIEYDEMGLGYTTYDEYMAGSFVGRLLTIFRAVRRNLGEEWRAGLLADPMHNYVGLSSQVLPFLHIDQICGDLNACDRYSFDPEDLGPDQLCHTKVARAIRAQFHSTTGRQYAHVAHVRATHFCADVVERRTPSEWYDAFTQARLSTAPRPRLWVARVARGVYRPLNLFMGAQMPDTNYVPMKGAALAECVLQVCDAQPMDVMWDIMTRNARNLNMGVLEFRERQPPVKFHKEARFIRPRVLRDTNMDVWDWVSLQDDNFDDEHLVVDEVRDMVLDKNRVLTPREEMHVLSILAGWQDIAFAKRDGFDDVEYWLAKEKASLEMDTAPVVTKVQLAEDVPASLEVIGGESPLDLEPGVSLIHQLDEVDSRIQHVADRCTKVVLYGAVDNVDCSCGCDCGLVGCRECHQGRSCGLTLVKEPNLLVGKGAKHLFSGLWRQFVPKELSIVAKSALAYGVAQHKFGRWRIGDEEDFDQQAECTGYPKFESDRILLAYPLASTFVTVVTERGAQVTGVWIAPDIVVCTLVAEMGRPTQLALGDNRYLSRIKGWEAKAGLVFVWSSFKAGYPYAGRFECAPTSVVPHAIIGGPIGGRLMHRLLFDAYVSKSRAVFSGAIPPQAAFAPCFSKSGLLSGFVAVVGQTSFVVAGLSALQISAIQQAVKVRPYFRGSGWRNMIRYEAWYDRMIPDQDFFGGQPRVDDEGVGW